MTDADAAPSSVGVVVVAAGSGSRQGADVPKAFVHLGGRPRLAHALDTIARMPGRTEVVVVAPAGLTDPDDPLWSGVDLPAGAVVVPGGAERTDSVAAGMAALPPGCETVGSARTTPQSRRRQPRSSAEPAPSSAPTSSARIGSMLSPNPMPRFAGSAT